ncbi:IS1096 element passenger TnpR family protein [Caminibacter sp.]
MYQFRVIQNGYFDFPKLRGMPTVEILVPADYTLEDFADVILKSFDFENDHAFGFYDNWKKIRESKNCYELFADEEMESNCKGVKNTLIKDVFKEEKQRMTMIFDYGDMWHFIIDFKKKVDMDLKEAKVIKRKGKPFKQYSMEFVFDNSKCIKYQSLSDKLETLPVDEAEKKLKNFIKRNPKCFEVYLDLYFLLLQKGEIKEAYKLLEKGYKKIDKMFIDEFGEWPDVMEWGWMENRPIIRLLVNYGIYLWKMERTDESLNLFKKLLEMNPNDNPGVRYFILAIKEGMSFQEFDNKFNKGGYYTVEIDEWFEKNYLKYKEDFEDLV